MENVADLPEVLARVHMHLDRAASCLVKLNAEEFRVTDTPKQATKTLLFGVRQRSLDHA
jgi:hypothetical protein